MTEMQEKVITNKALKRFKHYLYEEERSENTIEKYMRDIRFFREWLQDRNIDKSVVIEYKKELCERGGADIFLDSGRSKIYMYTKEQKEHALKEYERLGSV